MFNPYLELPYLDQAIFEEVLFLYALKVKGYFGRGSQYVPQINGIIPLIHCIIRSFPPECGHADKGGSMPL